MSKNTRNTGCFKGPRAICCPTCCKEDLEGERKERGADQDFAYTNMNLGLDSKTKNDDGNGNEISKDMELRKEKSERKIERIANTIDRITQVFLPAAFVVFNAVYWPWLINGSSIIPKDSGGMYEVFNYF